MLSAIMQASKNVARGHVFFERFTATDDASSGPNKPFEVVLKSTGDEYTVPVDETILRVLRDAGHSLDHGCNEGVCGTCITDVLEEERAQGDGMTICVSRAKSTRLILDL